MKWKFEHKTLKRDNLTLKEFSSPIQKIIDFDKCAVVLLDHDFYEGDNQNVFCINES